MHLLEKYFKLFEEIEIKKFKNPEIPLNKLTKVNSIIYCQVDQNFIDKKSNKKAVVFFNNSISLQSYLRTHETEEHYIIKGKLKYPILNLKSRTTKDWIESSFIKNPTETWIENGIVGDEESLSLLKQYENEKVIIGIENAIQIAPSDLSSFEIVDKFSDYETEPNSFSGNHILPEKDFLMLNTYMHNPKKHLNKKNIENIKALNIKLNKSYKLYRGLIITNEVFKKYFKSQVPHKNDIIKSKNTSISSWSKNLLVAKAFATNKNYSGIIIEYDAKPEEIMIDTTMIDKEQLKLLYEIPEREIILMPGNYNVKIIEEIGG